jgi:cell division protein FtsI/penicillin-binding protein 2
MVLSGFLLTGAILAGAALLFPDLVADLDLGGSDETTASTEPPIVDGSDQQAAEALDVFVEALEAGDLNGVRFAAESVVPASGGGVDGTTTSVGADQSVDGAATTVPEADVPPGTGADSFVEITRGLDPFTITAIPGEVVVVDATTAEAPLELRWTFGDVEWTTSSSVDLRMVGERWLVSWEPSILEPTLRSGDQLISSAVTPDRAPILARDGSALVETVEVVEVGVQPSRVEDLTTLTQRLEEVLGVDGDELAARVQDAPPDAFVEVVTLPAAEYAVVRDDVFPLPGTVFDTATRPVATDPNLARAVIGRSGEVTAEVLEEFPGLFEPGDYAGLSGLQSIYNPVLVGQPGFEVSVIRAGPNLGTTTTGTGLITTSSVVERGEAQSLFSIPAVDGQPVRTTLDPTLQRAAEAALERTELTSAMVVIQASTGEVLALANGPSGASVNFAMTGQYPPGSIFKVVTGYALLRDTLRSSDPVDCPQRVVISGAPFRNAENEVLGTVSFRDAFAHSCNTAFINATREFAPDTLNRAGADFGLGVPYDIGAPAYEGSVPVTEEDVDLAATAFGQGDLLVSPLNAAVMSATAADGTYRSPILVTSPAQDPQVVAPLEPGPADELRELMRAVVTEGTGRAVAGVDGPPVAGKTGTAQFGGGENPPSHAWFVGFQGDLAFAVFVEAGEFGGSTAAPIAADFLNSIR